MPRDSTCAPPPRNVEHVAFVKHVRGLIYSQFRNAAEFSRSIGVKPVNVAAYLKGHAKPNPRFVERVINGLSLSADERMKLWFMAARANGFPVYEDVKRHALTEVGG